MKRLDGDEIRKAVDRAKEKVGGMLTLSLDPEYEEKHPRDEFGRFTSKGSSDEENLDSQVEELFHLDPEDEDSIRESIRRDKFRRFTARKKYVPIDEDDSMLDIEDVPRDKFRRFTARKKD